MLARAMSLCTFPHRIIRWKPAGWLGAGASCSRMLRKGASIALTPLLLLGGCTPGSSPMVKLHGVPVGSFEQQLNEACGQPIAYPLGAQCIGLMGSAGPMLQHRSDLVMRIWRSCPDDNPCYRVTQTDPVCGGQGLTAVSDRGGGAGNPCERAQEANYSCAALRNDLVYQQRLSQPPTAQDPYDNCAQNKNDLADYDKKIEEMSVRIQWYRIFAEKGF
jgi:hypothetical protein